jgi:hypothetical protein
MRSASLKIRNQLKGSGCCGAAAAAVVDSAREGARSAVAEWVGDFLSPFWLSGDLVIAGEVIL